MSKPKSRKQFPDFFLPCPGCGGRIFRQIGLGKGSTCEDCGAEFPFSIRCDFVVRPGKGGKCLKIPSALLDGLHPRCDLHLSSEERERAAVPIPARDLGSDRGLARGGRRIIHKGEFPGQHCGGGSDVDS